MSSFLIEHDRDGSEVVEYGIELLSSICRLEIPYAYTSPAVVVVCKSIAISSMQHRVQMSIAFARMIESPSISWVSLSNECASFWLFFFFVAVLFLECSLFLCHPKWCKVLLTRMFQPSRYSQYSSSLLPILPQLLCNYCMCHSCCDWNDSLDYESMKVIRLIVWNEHLFVSLLQWKLRLYSYFVRWEL